MSLEKNPTTGRIIELFGPTVHACQKYSGRVGRSAAAKSLGEAAVRLAVIAHIRHTETEYDSLLATGYELLMGEVAQPRKHSCETLTRPVCFAILKLMISNIHRYGQTSI